MLATLDRQVEEVVGQHSELASILEVMMALLLLIFGFAAQVLRANATLTFLNNFVC